MAITATTKRITPLLERYLNLIPTFTDFEKIILRHRYYIFNAWQTVEQVHKLAETDGLDLGFVSVVLWKPDDIIITAALSVDKATNPQSKSKVKQVFVAGAGHTNFKTERGGWASFDRVG